MDIAHLNLFLPNHDADSSEHVDSDSSYEPAPDSEDGSKPISSHPSPTQQPEYMAHSPPKSSTAFSSAMIPFNPAQTTDDAFQFDLSDSDSPFFTPMTSATSLPTLAISPALDPLRLPQAQSGPPSPFAFPGNLVGFSELVQSSNEVSSFDVPSQFCDVDARPAAIQLPLLFQPHSSLDHAATSPGSLITSKQTSNESHCTSSMSFNTVGDGFSSGAASLKSQIELFGDEAISAYRSQKLSAYEKCQPTCPQEALETSYNSLIDTKNAISMQQALILSDIGSCIQQLLKKLHAYDNSNAIKASIDDEICYIETENHRRNFSINFYSLELHRSTCSPYGPSFLQKHRLLFIRFQKYLHTRAAFQVAASVFLDNPSLLRDDPSQLLQLFPLD